MLYGAPAASAKEIDDLNAQGFHFAEISIPNPAARHMWWESGIKNASEDGFFLLAHGPLEDPSQDDVRYLWDHYLPTLTATVDTASRMGISFLTIHMSVDRRLISGLRLAEKVRALKELVAYAQSNDVVIGLENVTESASDLESVLNAVPELYLTLDVGHAQLGSPLNYSVEIVKRLGPAIRHLHVHDNRGGVGEADDLHLPVGEGIIDFPSILKALVGRGYKGTMTLEMKPQGSLHSRNRIQYLIDEIMRRNSH
jgi:sugar phosphate isomerase/epimerase